MYCRKCGAQNENTQFCVNCGEPLKTVIPVYQDSSRPMMQSVPSHLVEAILSTLFCCMPLGIVAIVFAAQVNSKLQMGDYNGALSASKNAGLFSWLSIGLGAGVSILYILFYVIMGLAGAGNY